MIEWFLQVFATNTVAQGVFAGALAAAPISIVLWLLKDVPLQIKDFILRQVSHKFIFLSTGDNYYQHVDHLSKYIIWSRNSTSSTNVGEIKRTLGYGNHYGKYEGRFFRINKELEKSDATTFFKEKTTLTVYDKNDTILNQLLVEINQSVKKSKDKKVRVSEDGYWETICTVGPRSWDSVFFHKKDSILEFVQEFIDSSDLYLNRGIPYHTGIMLYGEPGTGKTSLIHALANKLSRHIYILNIANLDRSSIQSLLSGDWNDRILVIEDIDVSGATINRNEEKDSITLSELLNALDGITTPNGLIVFATTNKIDSLDQALVRPGRFDMLVEVGRLTKEEALDMAVVFEKSLPEPYSPMTGAELRNYFLKN